MDQGRVVQSSQRPFRRKLQLSTQANPYRSLWFPHLLPLPSPQLRLRHLHVRLRLRPRLQQRRLPHHQLPVSQLPHRSKRSRPTLALHPERTRQVSRYSESSKAATQGLICGSGTGNCDGAVNGANGKPIEVPCSCPPDQATFNTVRDGSRIRGRQRCSFAVSISFRTLLRATRYTTRP